MQNIVDLSITDAEIIKTETYVQEMLCVRKVLLESMGLEVEKPMIFHSENKRATDLAIGWSTS